jgi:anti-sigma regulatory factor (Ser/Thr protein kinase)
VAARTAVSKAMTAPGLRPGAVVGRSPTQRGTTLHTTMMTAPPPTVAHAGDSDSDIREALRRAQRVRSERPQFPASTPDLFLRHRVRGFVAQMTATADTLSTVRQLTVTVPVAYGADREVAEAAELVVSELVGNAVRACDDRSPLVVVEVTVTDTGIAVDVHDPLGDLLPIRREKAMHSDDAESGRGLHLLDVLAPGWTVEPSPIGKRISCHVRVLGAA